jgi:histidyl-tRNA synthetase
MYCRWAAGVERIAMLVPESILPPEPRPIHIIPVFAAVDNETKATEIVDYALRVCQALRHAGHMTTTYDEVPCTTSSSLGRQIRYALKLRARFVVLIGENELVSKSLTVKDLDTQQQTTLTLQQFLSSLDSTLREIN